MTSLALAPAVAVVVGAVLLRALGRLRRRRPGLGTRAERRPPMWAVEVGTAVGVPPHAVHAAWLLAVGATPVAAAVVGPGLALALGGAAFGSPVLLRGALRRRADARLDAALPLALDAVARSLRTGASLRQAMADAAADTPGHLGDDLRGVVDRASAGIPLREALDHWGQARPRPGVLLAVAALGLAVETGGASARAVDGVAATLRSRLSLQEEATALSAQARTSAVVLAAAPLVVCVLTLVGGGGAADFLLRSRLGIACLLAGLALDAVGGLWMARLTRAPANVPATPRTCVRIAPPSAPIRTQVGKGLPSGGWP